MKTGRMIVAVFAGVGNWNQLNINMIWVDEPYRNRGIGSELLAEIEREGKEIGAYFAFIELSADWNAAFFRKNGYAEAGSWEDVPKGHVTYVMKRRF